MVSQLTSVCSSIFRNEQTSNRSMILMPRVTSGRFSVSRSSEMMSKFHESDVSRRSVISGEAFLMCGVECCTLENIAINRSRSNQLYSRLKRLWAIISNSRVFPLIKLLVLFLCIMFFDMHKRKKEKNRLVRC